MWQNTRPKIYFLELLCLTHYLDCSLCIFFYTSLTERFKAHLSVSGPFLWSGCWLTTTPLSSSASLRSQPHSRPRAQPAVLYAHHGHPAKAHCRHRVGPASMSVAEPMPVAFTAPEFNGVSDHVREPATSSIIESIFIELKGMNWSPAHTPAADGTLCLLSAALNLLCLCWFCPALNLLCQPVQSLLQLKYSNSASLSHFLC